MPESAIFKPAWRMGDPALEADAIDFWTKNNLLRPNVPPEARAKELCGLVYRDGEVIAVSTAIVQEMPKFRCRMALYRCAAARSFRRNPFSLQVTVGSRNLLESWSRENPDEGVMGMAAIVESPVLARHMPSVFWPADLVFMGYMENGRQLRVSWFKHATVTPSAKPRRDGFGQVPA